MSVADMPVQMLNKGWARKNYSKRHAGVLVRELPPIAVRLPPALVDHLARAAEANGRSRHAEIVARLAESAEGESFDEHGLIVTRSAPAAK